MPRQMDVKDTQPKAAAGAGKRQKVAKPVPPPPSPAAKPAPDSDASPPPPEVSVPVSETWVFGVVRYLAAHHTYPDAARAQGRTGVVVVQFTVLSDGQVVDVALVRGSGTPSLDKAALALVHDARLPPFPPEMQIKQQTITLPIRYELE